MNEEDKRLIALNRKRIDFLTVLETAHEMFSMCGISPDDIEDLESWSVEYGVLCGDSCFDSVKCGNAIARLHKANRALQAKQCRQGG